MKTIPDINRSEWREILTGTLDVTINSYLMKMMLSQVKEQLQEKSISLDNAVIELHAKCVRFSNTKGVLEDINLIFKKKKQLKEIVVKEDKKENLNFEIEDLSPTDMQIKQDKILFDSVAEKSEITTLIEDTKKLNQEQAITKPAPTSFKNKESVVDSKDVVNTNNIIEDARLKVAKERTAFEKTLKQEKILKKSKIKKTSTVNKIEKQLIDEKRDLLIENPIVKTELKTKTSTTALDSYPDKTKKNIEKKSFLGKLSTIFFPEE